MNASDDFIQRRSIMPIKPLWGTAAEWKHMAGVCNGVDKRPRKSDCKFCVAVRARRQGDAA